MSFRLSKILCAPGLQVAVIECNPPEYADEVSFTVRLTVP